MNTFSHYYALQWDDKNPGAGFTAGRALYAYARQEKDLLDAQIFQELRDETAAVLGITWEQCRKIPIVAMVEILDIATLDDIAQRYI